MSSRNSVPKKAKSKSGAKVEKKSKKHKKKEEQPDVFYVEKILSHREGSKGREWLVKWWNYDESHNSWEPRQSFLGNAEMLAEYEKKVAATKTKSGRVIKRKKMDDEDDGEDVNDAGSDFGSAQDEDDDLDDDGDDDDDDGVVEPVKVQKKRSGSVPSLEKSRSKGNSSGGLKKSKDKSTSSKSSNTTKKSKKKEDKTHAPKWVFVEKHLPTLAWSAGKMATLLHVPHDVIRSKIMSYLSWSNARACSKVCWGLRSDAKARMYDLARQTFGEVARDPDTQNVAMAALQHYRDLELAGTGPIWNKSKAMSEFAIPESKMRQIPVSYNRRYDVQLLIQASLRRFGSMERMKAYKKGLADNRKANADIRAQYPQRLAIVNEALEAAGYPNMESAGFVQERLGVDKWVRSGKGNQNAIVERYIDALRARDQRAMREAEMEEQLLAEGFEIPPPSRRYYQHIEPDDPVRQAISLYGVDGRLTLDAGMLPVREIYRLRGERAMALDRWLQVTFDFSWAQLDSAIQLSRSSEFDNVSQVWRPSRYSGALSSARTAHSKWTKHGRMGDLQTLARAAWNVYTMTQLGPAAELACAKECGERWDPRFLESMVSLFAEGMTVPQEEEDAPALDATSVVDVDSGVDLGEVLSAFKRGDDDEVRATQVLSGIFWDFVERQEVVSTVTDGMIGVRSLHPFLGVVGSHVKVHPYVTQGGVVELERLRSYVDRSRLAQQRYEADLFSTMELAGEDFTTVDPQLQDVMRSELLFTSQSRKHHLGEELLVCGVEAEVQREDTDPSMVIQGFYKRHPARGVVSTSVNPGEVQAWHNYEMKRVHMLFYPWEWAHYKDEAAAADDDDGDHGGEGSGDENGSKKRKRVEQRTFHSVSVRDWPEGLSDMNPIWSYPLMSSLGEGGHRFHNQDLFPTNLSISPGFYFSADAGRVCPHTWAHVCRTSSLLPPTTKTMPDDVMEIGREEEESRDDQEHLDYSYGRYGVYGEEGEYGSSSSDDYSSDSLEGGALLPLVFPWFFGGGGGGGGGRGFGIGMGLW